ncbi:MAG: LysR family transcriptional regulator [Pseudolabrys sp.]
MTNIPTELLRALVAVVDHRSFTKAAAAVGLTQPAVSTQIKRLQFLLDCEVFDRSTHGIKLTPQGEMVVSYARRLLSINDQIMKIGGAGPRPELVIRVGTPSDFVASILPSTLAHFRERWPDVRFIVRTGYFDALARDLHSGSLDLLVGLSISKPHDARHAWAQETVWARGLTTELDPNGPVPLVSYGDPCIYHRLAVQVLQQAGLDWEDVFTGPSIISLSNAVVAGLGTMAIIRRRANDHGMMIWEDAPLPKLPDIYSGIYLREGGERAAYEQLADDIAEALTSQPPVIMPKLVPAASKPHTTVA